MNPPTIVTVVGYITLFVAGFAWFLRQGYHPSQEADWNQL